MTRVAADGGMDDGSGRQNSTDSGSVVQSQGSDATIRMGDLLPSVLIVKPRVPVKGPRERAPGATATVHDGVCQSLDNNCY